MTAYFVVDRDAALHPDQPKHGFASALEAEAWLAGMFLAPQTWRVEPFTVEA